MRLTYFLSRTVRIRITLGKCIYLTAHRAPNCNVCLWMARRQTRWARAVVIAVAWGVCMFGEAHFCAANFPAVSRPSGHTTRDQTQHTARTVWKSFSLDSTAVKLHSVWAFGELTQRSRPILPTHSAAAAVALKRRQLAGARLLSRRNRKSCNYSVLSVYVYAWMICM